MRIIIWLCLWPQLLQERAIYRRKMNKKQKGYTRDKQLYSVWKEVTEALMRSFESASDWKTRAENNIFSLKKHLHGVLNSASVQNFHSTCRALRRHAPYAHEVLPREHGQRRANRISAGAQHRLSAQLCLRACDVPAAVACMTTCIGSCDFCRSCWACRDDSSKDKYRLLPDEQMLERTWALWQATPLICSIDAPFHVKPPTNSSFLTRASKTTDVDRRPQHYWFGKMWDSATEARQLRLQVPTAGEKVCPCVVHRTPQCAF